MNTFLRWSTVRKLDKSCVLVVFFFLFKIVDHGGRWGDTAWALARWRHLVALHEATDALHWAMRPALYRRIRMAIDIDSNLPAFFVVVDFVVGHNCSQQLCYGHNNIKPSYKNVLMVDFIA